MSTQSNNKTSKNSVIPDELSVCNEVSDSEDEELDLLQLIRKNEEVKIKQTTKKPKTTLPLKTLKDEQDIFFIKLPENFNPNITRMMNDSSSLDEQILLDKISVTNRHSRIENIAHTIKSALHPSVPSDQVDYLVELSINDLADNLIDFYYYRIPKRDSGDTRDEDETSKEEDVYNIPSEYLLGLYPENYCLFATRLNLKKMVQKSVFIEDSSYLEILKGLITASNGTDTNYTEDEFLGFIYNLGGSSHNKMAIEERFTLNPGNPIDYNNIVTKLVICYEYIFAHVKFESGLYALMVRSLMLTVMDKNIIKCYKFNELTKSFVGLLGWHSSTTQKSVCNELYDIMTELVTDKRFQYRFIKFLNSCVKFNTPTHITETVRTLSLSFIMENFVHFDAEPSEEERRNDPTLSVITEFLVSLKPLKISKLDKNLLIYLKLKFIVLQFSMDSLKFSDAHDLSRLIDLINMFKLKVSENLNSTEHCDILSEILNLVSLADMRMENEMKLIYFN